MTTAAGNPYSPPQAEVKDARLLAERPKQIVHATALMWLTLGIGLVSEAFPPATPPVPWATRAGGAIFASIVAIVLIVAIWRGRRWARVAYAVFEVLGIIGVPIELSAGYPPIRTALDLVSIVIGLMVLYLTFTKPGSLWFQFRSERA